MTNTLQCTMCGSRITYRLSDFDQAALRRERVLTRFCRECLTHTKWQVAAGEEDGTQASSAMQLANGVLLVGSDLSTLRQVQATVESCGGEAEIVTSFEEALTRIARHDFDLIISEHSPPAFDATRIMNFIKRHRPECVAQICFLLAATASPEEMALLTESGVTPWSASRLDATRHSDHPATPEQN